MSTTGQLRTFSDLYLDLLSRIRAQQTGAGATAVETAKKFINIALQDIHIGAKERLPWAERRGILITQPSYDTGTVTIAQGATALAGASTAWATANAFGAANMRAGGKIVLAGGREVYEIASVTDDTNAVLTSRFTQSDLTAAFYVYFEDEYALAADFLRAVDFRFFDLNRTISLLPRNEFRRRFVLNQTPGKPVACTIMDAAPSGDTSLRRRIAFDRPADQAYMLPYAYITSKLVVSSAGVAQEELSADADEPLLPLPFRHMIGAKALYWMYRDRRDDNRANAANAEFTDLWLRMANDYEFGQARPTMTARVGSYMARAKRPMSGGTPGVTSGTAFDEFRE